jgi:hypothetical protein
MFFSFLPSLPVSNFARPRQHDTMYSAQQHATWPSISHISPPSFRSTRSSAQRAAAPTLVGLPTVGLPTRWGLSSWPPPGTCCSRATQRPSCTSRFMVHRGRIAPANAFGSVVSFFYRVYAGTYNKDVVSRFFLPSPSYRATIARWRQRVGSSRYCTWVSVAGKRRRRPHVFAFTGIAPRRRRWLTHSLTLRVASQARRISLTLARHRWAFQYHWLGFLLISHRNTVYFRRFFCKKPPIVAQPAAAVSTNKRGKDSVCARPRVHGSHGRDRGPASGEAAARDL